MTSEIDGSVTHFFGQLRAGKRAAADALWERYCPRLLALARKTLAGRRPRGADPEDAVQSAFVSFWQRAERGQFVGAMDRNQLWNLLGLITVRKSLKQLQRERTRKRGGGRVVSETDLANREGHAVSFEQFAGSTPAPEFDLVCDDLLSALEDEPRAIALYRLMGYSNREISELMDCTERTVERKLNLIRAIWEDSVSG
jgi:RNA polymerase sigma factor (sigma-70 family)